MAKHNPAEDKRKREAEARKANKKIRQRKRKSLLN